MVKKYLFVPVQAAIYCVHILALIALALTRYGAEVEIMLCDKVLKGCHMMTSVSIAEDDYVRSSKKLCNSCLDREEKLLKDWV